MQAKGRDSMSYEQQLILQTIQGLFSYTRYLADANLDSNRNRIEQIGKFAERMAFYGGIMEGEENVGILEKEKFMAPVKQLLDGKNAISIPKFNERLKIAILEGLQQIKKDLILDCDPVYEEDINLCQELIQNVFYADGSFYKIFDAVQGLEAYAGSLAVAGREKYRDEIEKLQDLMEQMATYGAVTGSEQGAMVRIKEKYLDPITKLLEGEQEDAVPEYTEGMKKAILKGIQYYKKELKAEFGSESESDIQLCDEIAQNMEEDSPEWTQLQMH